ncbi:FliH/SctL family protein [Georgenia sp. H159]|uniref:FliH/SctL family protein n=1 Tax=Georgenia sp. H159 TaxID=3076115 RepID=UPI002D787664|nr:FliH/SctL family protein [Georgenia sp. H159]
MSLDAVSQTSGFVPFHTPRAESASVVEGYASGYSAGWSAGARAALKDAEEQRAQIAHDAAARADQAAAAAREALTTLARAAAVARDRLTPVVGEVEQGLTEAAVSLAEALLGAELRDDDASARSALLRALSVQDSDIVRIRLNPRDLTHLEATLDTLPADLQVPAGVELVADAGLARGDAVSELPEGFLDARLSTALARVRAALEVEQ